MLGPPNELNALISFSPFDLPSSLLIDLESVLVVMGLNLPCFSVLTGARRGELAALTWADIDFDAATIRIEKSLEQTVGRLAVKSTKTRAGCRTISLPEFAVLALRDHRRKILELRLVLGAGALPGDHPVFGDHEGAWPSPQRITGRWRDALAVRGLPRVTFHSLRHCHASALIAAGLDVVAIARRLGHASPALTLSVYSHLFVSKDSEAAAAIDKVFG